MKNTQKRVALILALVLCLVVWLPGCAQQPAPTPQAPPPQQPADQAPQQPEPEPEQQHFTVGVIQLMEHRALADALRGFTDELADNGFVDGENLTILYENAQGDISTLATIADRHVSRNVDLVLSISTPATQAIAAATETIPVLGTAVTSYTAAGIIESNERPGGNISGASDMNPVAAQVDLLVELVPDVQTIGLIFNSGEANSVVQADIAKAHIEAIGLQWHEVTVTGPADVIQAMQALVGRVEAVYIPACNTMAASMPAVHSVAMEARLPTVTGANSMVIDGGLATMGICYYALGRMTGQMALQVFAGANPGEMPIQFADVYDDITINGIVAEEIGFVVPERFAAYVVFPE